MSTGIAYSEYYEYILQYVYVAGKVKLIYCTWRLIVQVVPELRACSSQSLFSFPE
jgi:hypothetical protein